MDVNGWGEVLIHMKVNENIEVFWVFVEDYVIFF